MIRSRVWLRNRMSLNRQCRLATDVSGMGSDSISSVGRIGLGSPPKLESNPFRLRMIRFVTVRGTRGRRAVAAGRAFRRTIPEGQLLTKGRPGGPADGADEIRVESRGPLGEPATQFVRLTPIDRQVPRCHKASRTGTELQTHSDRQSFPSLLLGCRFHGASR